MSSADDKDSESAAPFPTCSNCRYWEREDELSDGGICRRYPPSIRTTAMDDNDEYSGYPIWPLTLEDEWCGEHKPKENKGNGDE